MIDVHLDTDGTGHLSLPSGSRTIAATSLSEARADVIVILTNQAQTSGRILHANVTVTAEGTTTLEVHPNGTINEIANPQPQEPVMTASTPQPVPVAEAQPTTAPTPVPPRPEQAPQAQSDSPATPENTGPIPQAAPASPMTQTAPFTDGFITTDPPVARSFVKQSKDVPAEGFRGFVSKASGGLVNPGLSRRELHRRELHQRVAKPITGTRNIVFMCLKGGISKTSTTCGVGLSLAEFRPDAVLAVDTNPDAGDLADRLIGHDQVESLSPRTITDLVGALDSHQIDSLTDLNRYTQTSGRLHFIAGEQDPDVSESLTAEQYISVRDTVDRFYPITLTDCGTGVTHPAMKGILERGEQMVVASGWAVTGAKRAQRTLTWLHEANDGAYRELAENAIVVLTDTGATSKDVDRDAIISTLEHLCRDVHIVPFDPEVGKGDLISLDALRPATRQAYLEVGASIMDAL
ncbi:MinD/ParA family ATP-binding protein [Brevibacterium linens]|uniref:MinD/ParA family ATP-binding protein n=1 Tax=Brevibacterium linens TaxID=1703 RepID=UPI003F8A38A9